MQAIIASLRAENKSLLDQNTFLRSLVTNCKYEVASSQNGHQQTASVLPDQSCVRLNMLESDRQMEVDDDGKQTEDLDVMKPRSRTVTSTLSTQHLWRVLHEAPTSCGIEKCSSEASLSVPGFVATVVGSWWQLLSSSELVFGVLLNVLSFVAIVVLYQLWQSYWVGRWPRKCAVQSKLGRHNARRHTELSSSNLSATNKCKEKENARTQVIGVKNAE
ncbi:unnamed protein product [Peronospora belbahrii]|nr:unnamed protein product [Peronospora belbahrii]